MTSLHCCLKTAFEKDTAGYRGNPLLKQNFDSDRQIETAVNDPTKGLKPKPTFNQAMAQIEEDRAYVENMYDEARSEAPKLKSRSLRKLMYNDILLKTLEKEKQKRAKFLAFGMTPDEIMQARRQERDNMVTEAVNTPFDQLPEHIRARIHANGGMTALQADGMSFDEYRNAIEQAVAGVPQDQLNLLSVQANDGSSDRSSIGGSSYDSFYNLFEPATYSNDVPPPSNQAFDGAFDRAFDPDILETTPLPEEVLVEAGAGAGAGAGAAAGGDKINLSNLSNIKPKTASGRIVRTLPREPLDYWLNFIDTDFAPQAKARNLTKKAYAKQIGKAKVSEKLQRSIMRSYNELEKGSIEDDYLATLTDLIMDGYINRLFDAPTKVSKSKNKGKRRSKKK